MRWTRFLASPQLPSKRVDCPDYGRLIARCIGHNSGQARKVRRVEHYRLGSALSFVGAHATHEGGDP